MTKFRKNLLVSFLFCAAILYSQKQNNQWRFGGAGAIDFNNVPPSFVTGCQIATGEGSASVADRVTGALLFYTDGVTVWNANNQIMPNGTGLLGGVAPAPNTDSLSSTTAAVIVPKPGSTNLFYIVTIDQQSSNNGVRYSVLDMTLNGGVGDVVAGQKNIFLLQTISEKLEVVPAADGVSYWLLTRDNSGDSFYSFRITSAGIQNTPVISTVGSAQGNGAGHMKINKQFNKLAIGVTFGSRMELFDFDNTTGVVSNPITWNFNLLSPLIYGIEFSPDGKVLYISDLNTILQYDLMQTTPLAIQNSVYQVATGGNTSLQLGIDDKIYVNAGSVNAISCPNKLGAACGYQTNVIANQTGGGGYGLPKWVYYADDMPIATTNSISKTGNCQGLPISFSIQNVNNIVSVSWDFGDPSSGTANNTSSSLTPQHTYNTAGTYIVNVVINYPCFTETIPLTFTINSPVVPTFNSIPALCDGDTAPVLPTTSLNGITGTWNPTTVSTSSSGTSTYTFTPNTGQCASVIPITIIVNPLVTPTFNSIPALCDGDTAPILPTTSLNGIIGTWNPTTINTSSSGTSTYTFTPNAGQCASVIPITIIVNPLVTPTFNSIPALCDGDSAPVLPTTSLNGITGTWNPTTVSNTTSGTYNFTPNVIVGQCYSNADINVTVLQQLVPDFQDVILCENQVGYVLSNQSPNGITGTWLPATINFSIGGNYTFTPNAGQCASPQTILVTISSSSLTDFQWIVSEPFSNNPTITIIPNSLGNYLYQLDFGLQQTSNVFQNVSSGFHTVRVTDANGCTDSIEKNNILIINYPKFFTPNGDGYNDTWNINDLYLQNDSKIYIYDKYGRLLQQIFPSQDGWDGKYNNNEMFSDDYWFVVEYEYNNTMKLFKSHFALKR
jgi:gliding motility-associated-like protein